MHDARLVGVGQALGGLADDVGGLVGRQGALIVDHLAHAGAVDELHGEVVVPPVFVDGHPAHDVRVLKLDGCLRLAEEPREERPLLGQVDGQDLQGGQIL